MQNTYITTPIYYVNDSAHIGHAYTTIIADVLARYARLAGRKTLFLTGCDEHGQKIEESAARAGVPPQQFTDEVSERFRVLWRELGISNDIFMRTTASAHCEAVQKIFAAMKARGDIYKGEYEGHYCVSCESFYAPNALAEGERCPDCGKATRMLKEESYFFALSRYEERLLEWIEANPDAIVPEGRRNEVVAFIRQGLRDLSITRTSFRWGVPVPDDPAHVVYVWLDALCNYITALGVQLSETGEVKVGADAELAGFWPASVHLVGKDILKFHAVYWPAFLMSLGLPLPRCVAAHGWWMAEGAKMSKSLGNVIAPMDVANAYGIDEMRYFMLSAMPFGHDGDFAHAAVAARVNSELCNELGNLLSRSLSLAHKFFGGEVKYVGGYEQEWQEAINALKAAEIAIEGLRTHEYCAQIMAALRVANQAVARYEPWALAKTDAPAASSLLAVIFSLLRAAGLLLAPVLTQGAPKLLAALGSAATPDEFARRYELAASVKVGENFHLYKRIDEAAAPEFLRAKNSSADCAKAGASGEATGVAESADKASGGGVAVRAQKSSGAAGGAAGDKSREIKIDDFAKIDMRIATVLSCEAVAGSEKLLKFMLDVGEKQPRQVLSGIAKFYAPEQLVGRQIVLLANLAARKIFKHLSEGMILSAKNSDESLVLLTPLAPCEPGARIG